MAVEHEEHDEQDPDEDRDHEPARERRADPGEVDERTRPLPDEPRLTRSSQAATPSICRMTLVRRKPSGDRQREQERVAAEAAARKTRTGCPAPTAAAKRSAGPPGAGSSSGAAARGRRGDVARLARRTARRAGPVPAWAVSDCHRSRLPVDAPWVNDVLTPMPFVVLLLLALTVGVTVFLAASRIRPRQGRRRRDGRQRRGGEQLGAGGRAAPVARAAAARPPRPGDGDRARSDARARDRRWSAASSSALLAYLDALERRARRARPSVGQWGADHATHWSTQMLQLVTDLASTPAAIAVIVVVVVVEMIRAPNRWMPPFLITVVVGEVVLVNIVKQLLDRVRPTFNPIAETLGPSFPSGHSATAAALYASVALVLARRRSPRDAGAARGRRSRASPSGSPAAGSCSASTGSPTSSPGSPSAGPGSRSARSPSAAGSSTSARPWRRPTEVAEALPPTATAAIGPARGTALRRRRGGSAAGRSSRRCRRETPGSRTSRCVSGSPPLDPVELLGRDRPPELVDDRRRIAGDVLLVALEVLAQSRSRVDAGDRLVVRDDVHLGVVEERVGVEVRGADGQPAVVDDPDLGVDVDDVAQRPLAGVHGAGEEAVVALVGLDQRRHLAARDVRAVVRARRQQDDDPEVVGRRMRRACRRGCRRPRATRGTGSRGRRSAPPSAARRGTTRGSSSRPCGAGLVRAGGHACATTWSVDVTGRLRLRRRGRAPRRVARVPAQAEVLGHVPHGRPFDPHRDVVPADAAARAVVRRVVGVAAVEREVDAADVGDAVVDHDRLLVVAVRRARARVERASGSSCAASSVRSISRTSPREGRNAGIGAPFQSRTRTSTLSASSASRIRTTSGSSSRLSASSGERNQPVRWTCDVAAAMSGAIRGSASEPSIRTSIVLPVARPASAAARSRAPSASRACSQPTRRRRRRCRPLIVRSMPRPSGVAELDGELVEEAAAGSELPWPVGVGRLGRAARSTAPRRP